MSTATLSPFTRIVRQDGRHSLDEWAARQAREMVSSIETHNVSDEIPQRSCATSREGRYAVHSGYWVPNVRTATLVQMWREIEAEAKGKRGKRGSLRAGCNNVDGCLVGEQLVESEGSDFADDQSVDSEGVLLKTPIAHGVSGGGDNEKGKVADVVRRFTAAIEEVDSREQTPRSLENGSGAMFDQAMNQSAEVVGPDNYGNSNYRRIRSPRAFKDFLIQVEGERRRELAGVCERRLVSQFANRGRIQSLLKVRSLSKEVIVQGKKKYSSSSVQMDKLQSGTSVLLLRQKFNSKGKYDAVSNNMLENDRSIEQEMHADSPSLDNLHQKFSRDSKQDVKKGSQKEESFRMRGLIMEPSSPTSNQAVEDEECNQSSGDRWRTKSSCIGLHESHGNESARDDSFESGDSKEILKVPSETGQHSSSKASSTGILKEDFSLNCEMDQLGKGQLRVTQSNLHGNIDHSSCDRSDTSEDKFPSVSYQPEEDIKIREFESQVYSPPLSVTGRDSKEASTSSDAECYQSSLCIDHLNWNERFPFQPRSKIQTTTDWLDKLSKNVVLHELYERKIVSTALASEFKDRLEQILVDILKKQEQEQEQETITEENELSLCHYCPNNSNSPSPKSDQMVVESFDQFDEQNNHLRNHSAEMDLILELRCDMARIRQEVSDLKRMITSCIATQLDLTRCIKEGIYPTKKCQIGKMSEQATKHENCCILCESQVDSLFYKCGHICACFNCAYDLQTKRGCCPICHALVVDVVRVQSDS